MAFNRKTVLIVEDSPIQAAALIQFLRQQGLRVLHAPNGRLGVSIAQQQTPDVIVLDVEMPEMDGFEACRQLKEDARTAGIPVVMLTIRNEPKKLLQGLDRGAIDFIPKDAFSYAVLLETLRQLHVLDGRSVEETFGMSQLSPDTGEQGGGEKAEGNHDAGG
jgi:CheY-like chemotaxis protein